MGFLKVLFKIVLTLAALVALVFVGARFHDGPISMIPGGPLASGNLVATPVTDWSFAENVDTIEMQLLGDDSSRTTWILVAAGRAFIPCSLTFPPGKSWYRRADVDGRALIRIDDKRYPVRLRRIADEPLELELEDLIAAKYGRRIPSDSGVWYFAIESRPL